MRINDPFEYVKFLLDEWGAWYVMPIPGLSYKNLTTEGRLMAEGAGASSGAGQRMFMPRYEGSPRNSAIHKAIDALNNPFWQNLLIARHAHQMKFSELEEVFKLSRSALNNELRCIYAMLFGYFLGNPLLCTQSEKRKAI